MPTLSVNQTASAPTQAARVSAPARLSTAQAMAPFPQAVGLTVHAAGPPRSLHVARTEEPVAQAVKLRVFPGAATPRPAGNPATPREPDLSAAPRP